MKNQKNLGQPLSEQEMKSIKGGNVFTSSEYGVRCPACGREVNVNTYTYYITCDNCRCVIPIEEEKDNDASK